jgi:hypothetical protein
VVNFTPQPLYLQGKSPWYTLDKRLGRPQSQSGYGGICWDEKRCLLQTPKIKNPEMSNLKNKGAKEWAPSLYPPLCPERHKHDNRSKLVHHLTGKLFPQQHDAK